MSHGLGRLKYYFYCLTYGIKYFSYFTKYGALLSWAFLRLYVRRILGKPDYIDINDVIKRFTSKAPKVDMDEVLPIYSPETENVSEMLRYDSLSEASNVTGIDYKDDESTMALGMLLTMEHGKRKSELLASMDDSTFSNELDNYMRIVKDIGFEVVLEIPFKSLPFREGDKVYDEKFFVLAHREYGILMYFDTYTSTRVNSSHIMYSWRRKPDVDRVPSGVLSTSSSDSESNPGYWRKEDYNHETDRMDDLYTIGTHDAREAIRHKINQLLKYGTFLKTWPKSDSRFWWLLHHVDTKNPDNAMDNTWRGYDYKAISKQRIEMLPPWVREMINV